ncbi:MAG: hypothetical protein KDC54_07755 [Lewinella sp.]|nr:hypothetical protein [Lewinella sp.]
MHTSPKTLLILLLMNFASILSFFGCRAQGGAAGETIQHGPFTIEKQSAKDRHFDMNRGGMVSTDYTRYRVLYQDQPVLFPAALEQNTGLPGLWKAYVLQGAPQPALIAGSQSLYLITEENGAVVVTPLYEQNGSFASLQWLDIHEGQPAPRWEVYRSYDRDTSNVLSGGEYLLISKHVVLQVADLSIHPFRQSTDLTDGYYAGEVIGFSPDQQELVFMGEKSDPADYLKYVRALLVYNYRTNAAYAVPIDRTTTRLHEPSRVPAGWLARYFIWERTEGDSLRLQPREFDQLPPWEGYFTKSLSYELSPVKVEMKDTLLAYVRETLDLPATAITEEVMGDYQRYSIRYGQHDFTIGFLSDLQIASFSLGLLDKDTAASNELIRRIGEGFNALLREGRYQEFFTQY